MQDMFLCIRTWFSEKGGLGSSERMVLHMRENAAFQNRPVTMNQKNNLLELEEHMYMLDDVEKP